MGLLENGQGSRAIMRLLVIQLLCWLGWFSTFAFAQFDISEGVTGSVNFPSLGITCVGNLAVFVTSLIRGRLDLDMGARDILDILLSPNLFSLKIGKVRFIKSCIMVPHFACLTTCTEAGVRPTTEETGLQTSAPTGGRDREIASKEENVVTNASTSKGKRVFVSEDKQEDKQEGAAAAAGAIGGVGSEEEHQDVAIAQVRASTERGPQIIAEENDLQSASTRAPDQTASTSTEKTVIRIDSEDDKEAVRGASPGKRGLQNASTSTEITVLQIDSEKNEEAVRGLQTASVIILSMGAPNWSMMQFMKSSAHVAHSILLACSSFRSVSSRLEGVTIEKCVCEDSGPWCHCIVFSTVKEVTDMLATRMPGILKKVTDSLWLLPCSPCLRKGCHEPNGDRVLSGESGIEEKTLRQSVVCDILEDIYGKNIYSRKPICICIPLNDRGRDNWTKLMVTSLRSKDAEGRGVRNKATEALQGYLDGGSRSEKESFEYDIFSFVVPRLTEALINLVLTFWFRVDGFSSALVARRTVRDYVVDSKSSGFPANAFLSKAEVMSNVDNSQVCQVLTFRDNNFLTFISAGCVNLICFLGWALLISFEGGADRSQPPTVPRVAVLIAAISTPWVVAMFLKTPWSDIEFSTRLRTEPITIPWFARILLLAVISPVVLPGVLIVALRRDRDKHPCAYVLIVAALLFEIVCYVFWTALALTLGTKGFGRWVYGVFQILVWLKWATGSYLLNDENSIEFHGGNPNRMLLLVYSSAFWLNAVLAGVRCKWEPWPWKHNHLF